MLKQINLFICLFVYLCIFFKQFRKINKIVAKFRQTILVDKGLTQSNEFQVYAKIIDLST